MRVLSLPGETVVCPGHSDSARPPETGEDALVDRLGSIRDRVGALSLAVDAFVERVATDLPPRPNNHERIVAINLGREDHERIVAINLGREDVDEGRAFELELGPNNCAVAN